MNRLLFILSTILLPLYSFCQINKPHHTTGTIYDTCRTWLFYQQTGNNGAQQQIAKARTVQDDGLISVGYSNSGPDKDALMIKQDRDGNKTWQKTYGLAGYDEEFTGFRELYNQELMTIGVVKDLATQKKAMMVCKMAPDGNLIWQKSFVNFHASRNIRNCKLYASTGDHSFFAAESDSAIIYGMLDGTGNMLWQRSLYADSSTHLVDAVDYYGDLLIAANSMDSGHHVVKMYYINYYWYGNMNIRFTKRFGGYYNNSNYIIHDMEQFSQYSYFSGIRSINNQPYELVRININQGSILEALENISTPGILIDSTARTALSIDADGLAFTGTRRSKDIHQIKLTNSENQNSYFYWSSTCSLPDSVELNGYVKTWDAGYNIIATKQGPAPEKKIIQVKTDSAGITPSCIPRTPENFGIARNTLIPDTIVYAYVTDSLIPYSYSLAGSNTISLDSNIYCRELKCPFVPLADTCINSFHRIYQGYNQYNYPFGLVAYNGTVYVAGIDYKQSYHPDNECSFVWKLTTDGHILNQKNYIIDKNNFGNITKTNDSSILLYGVSDSLTFFSVYCAKLDTNLNINWIKAWRIFNFADSYGGTYVNDVKQSNDGSYFILASADHWDEDHRVFLTKLSANGSFLWSKIFRINDPGAYNFVTGSKLALDAGNAFIICKNEYNSYSASIMLRVDQASGNLSWIRKFMDADNYVDVSDLINVYNNEIYLTGLANNYPYKNVIVKTDLNGNITKLKSHAVPGVNVGIRYTSTQNSDGSLNLVSSIYTVPPPPYINLTDCFVKLNSNFDIENAKKRSSPFQRTVEGLFRGPDQSVYEIGGEINLYADPLYNDYPYLAKYTPDGKLGICPSDTFVLAENTLSLSTVAITCVQTDTVFNLRIPPTSIEQNYMAEARLICSSVQGCDTLKITGQDTICNRNAVYTYLAHRNSGCNAPVQWNYDQTQALLIYSDDHAISLKFLINGNIKLKATIYSNCIPLIDSINIHVYDSPSSLNLGPDTILCNGASVLLNAHRGFKTYSWQDGSTDSVLLATSPGLYYVTVTDSCNTFYSDSVNISPDSYSPFDLGPDTMKCNKDTLVLHINTGFNNYAWSPMVNMIPVSPTMIKVFPDNTISYYVTATKTNGCMVMDSIKITVNHSPQINLGADTGICIQDSLKLNAGSSFINYIWSTGQTTPVIFVKAAGLYYVAAKDSNNCISKDSLRILQLFPLPVLTITPDSIICTGQSKILDAGPGYSSYLWSIGTNRRTVSISSTGTYWVRVTDAKGCKTSDTIYIRQQQVPPSQFLLFSDTVLCLYDTISIKANRIFNSYLWNNGTTNSVLRASLPGLYWLQVTDQAGCIGKDTAIITPKACYKKIYFPNSFTPNLDGINDFFKPKVYGYLDYFHLTIYSRWGQRVFETYDPNWGWNGYFEGLKQENGAFVWQCSFQFRDDIRQTQRGSFLLLR